MEFTAGGANLLRFKRYPKGDREIERILQRPSRRCRPRVLPRLLRGVRGHYYFI
jgi:hypothetical protein